MSEDYLYHLKQKEQEWEALCSRCGGCCGAFDDPCKHLQKDAEGLSFCEIYEQRFGIRETQRGEKFRCVPVAKILHTHWKNEHLCKYKQHWKTPWRRFE